MSMLTFSIKILIYTCEMSVVKLLYMFNMCYSGTRCKQINSSFLPYKLFIQVSRDPN